MASLFTVTSTRGKTKKVAAMQMTVFFGLDLKLQPIIRAAAMVGCLGLLLSTLSACLQRM